MQEAKMSQNLEVITDHFLIPVISAPHLQLTRARSNTAMFMAFNSTAICVSLNKTLLVCHTVPRFCSGVPYSSGRSAAVTNAEIQWQIQPRNFKAYNITMQWWPAHSSPCFLFPVRWADLTPRVRTLMCDLGMHHENGIKSVNWALELFQVVRNDTNEVNYIRKNALSSIFTQNGWYERIIQKCTFYIFHAWILGFVMHKP